MRRYLFLPAVALTLVALAARADEKKSELEPKALDILKKAAAVFKDSKSLHVEGVFVSDVENDNGKRHAKTEAIYDIQRPNRIALRTKIDGKASQGPDLICDGKNIFAVAKALKQYTEDDAPESMNGVAEKLQQLGLPNTGLLFQNVLADDPYDALMQGVTLAADAGTEKVNDTEAHHLKFEQPGIKWELWIAAKDKPYILKVQTNLDGDGGKGTIVETYQNWKVDGEIPKSAFNFTPPDDAKKVSAFRPNE
jgi:hypothetical protein